jgi:hypothetical protein
MSSAAAAQLQLLTDNPANPPPTHTHRLQRMSGIATATAAMVAAIDGAPTR